MEKVLAVLLLVLLGMFIPVGFALASYNYYIPISVTNNGNSTLTDMPVLVSLNNSQLVSLGYINSTGRDTDLQEGVVSRPYGLSDGRLGIFVPSISPGQKTTYNYRLGYSPTKSSLSVVVGGGGNVTVADDASLELGSNFSIEFKGWVDESLLVKKEGSLYLYVDDGNLYGELSNYGDINQDAGTNYADLYSGAYIRAAERVNGAPRGYIDSVSFRLAKAGSPTGTAYVRARQVSDDSIIGTFGSINVSTLTTTATWYGFTTDVFNPNLQDIRFSIEYSGGDVVNYVRVSYSASDVLANAMRSSYTSSWSDSSGHDLAIRVSFIDSVVSTPITSGEHTVKLAGNGTDLKLYVDGSEKDSDVLVSTPDNANNWILSMPYFNYYKHIVSGSLRVQYQPTSIISGTTLPDESGNGRTGTITWGNNPAYISVGVGGVQPFASYSPPGTTTSETIPPIVPSAGRIPTDETTGATGQGLPLYYSFKAGADALGWSVPTAYMVMFLIISVVMGVAGLAALHTWWGFAAGFGAFSLFFGQVTDSGGYRVVPVAVTILCVIAALTIGYLFRNN